MSKLTHDQKWLADVMSEISERCYCAGWMMGLEFQLWDALQNGPRRYGVGRIDEEDIYRLKMLSERTGGWIIYELEGDGETFVPLDEWLKIYKEGPKDL